MKPWLPYRVPTMAEIDAGRNRTGLSVVSTFSGCGGSCLGFEMAGFRILWASEFVEAARRSYAANHPDVVLDGRDIRQVQPAEILAATGKAVGEIDVLEGSPPCASFSTSGKRQKGWGEVRKYSDTEQRTDDLFFEFARILAGLRPRAFVAENVFGLVKGKAKGYFKAIFFELEKAGYRVGARLLDSQWLGVPQARQRIFFVGFRADHGLEPVFPEPLPYRYSAGEAVEGLERPPAGDPERGPDLGRVALRAWRETPPGTPCHPINFNSVRASAAKPSPTILASHGNENMYGVCHWSEPRRFDIPELRRISGFPDDFVLDGTFAERWERIGRSVPPLMMRAVAERVAAALGGRS